MQAELPLVALIGRPNVGKSTLFNRLVGKKLAIIADVAGTTRDRLEKIIEVDDKQFRLADMAGIEAVTSQHTQLQKAVQAQVEQALGAAAVIVWVVDGRQGLTVEDKKIGDLLRKLGRPLLVAINKCDHPQHDEGQYEFSAYQGNGQITISALHGRGVGELLEAISTFIPTQQEIITDERELRIAILGRPNVGKSTLLNTLVRDERSVVSEEAGTTRDTVDTVVPAGELFSGTYTQWEQVRIIDTAGIRRRGKIGKEIEHWSLIRTKAALDEAEIVLFVIDAMEGMVHQDLQIAQLIEESGKAVILLVNKWDQLLEKKEELLGTEEEVATQEHFLIHLRQTAPFLYWIQVLFISAKLRMNTNVLGHLLVDAYRSWNLQVDQETLDGIATELRRLPRLKNLTKITLEHAKPPVFHLHVEGKQLPHFSTLRHVDNELRDLLELGPTPIKIWAVPSVQRRTKGSNR